MTRVAAIQMVSTPEVERNLAEAESLIRQAAAEGAEFALLPEYFSIMGREDTDKLRYRVVALPDDRHLPVAVVPVRPGTTTRAVVDGRDHSTGFRR